MFIGYVFKGERRYKIVKKGKVKDRKTSIVEREKCMKKSDLNIFLAVGIFTLLVISSCVPGNARIKQMS